MNDRGAVFHDTFIQRRTFLALALIACCFFIDQAAKVAVLRLLTDGTPWPLIGDTIHLRLVQNRGAIMSLGGGAADIWRWSFLVWTCLLLFVVLGYGLFSSPARWTTTMSTGLMFAGGVSNLADRLFHDGSVVDFISIDLPGLRLGVFNLADLMIGAGFLLFAVSKSSESGFFSRRGIREEA